MNHKTRLNFSHFFSLIFRNCIYNILQKIHGGIESKQSDEEEYSDDTDVSDTEQDDTDEENFRNGHNYDKTFHLNKSLEGHAGKKRKLSTPSARRTIWDNFQFKENMYRVIPIRLDQKVYDSINPMKQ